MDEDDVQQLALEALCRAVQSGKADGNLLHLGRTIRLDTIDALREYGVLVRNRQEHVYSRPEVVKLDALSPRQREVLLASAVSDDPAKIVAERLGMTTANFYTTKHEALQTLRGLASERLTRREVQVLRCAADGLTNEETAAKLGISVETIKTHRRHIIGALGAHSTTHAVAIAFRRGTIF